MDESTAELVTQCNNLLTEAKTQHSAGDLDEAERLLQEAHRCGREATRSSGTGFPVDIPANLELLAKWELPAPPTVDV